MPDQSSRSLITHSATLDRPVSVHARQWRTNEPLTVWRCTCGTLEVGTPDAPYPTRPGDHRAWRLRRHDWTPVSKAEANTFLDALDTPTFGTDRP